MNLTLPFTFELPTHIVYGLGVVKRAAEFLEQLQRKKVMIITDEGISKLRWFSEIISNLNFRGYSVHVFTGVEPNPKDTNVIQAARACQDVQADCILSIGGGSPIDCAKVTSILAVYGGSPRDYEDRSRIGNQPLPIIAIPTTAGTGSEVTFGAVITDSKAKFKFTVKSPWIAPRFALIDPELTLSKPPALTAATGMDALTHAIEAYTSRAAEPISDACALYAAELIASSLPTAVQDGSSLEARAAVLLGSLIAGIAFSHSDVGAVHCIAEALGGMYDLPHGVCNAVCLPYVMDYCMEANKERYARLGAAMGVQLSELGALGAQASVRHVQRLAQRVGLPPFKSFKVPPRDYPQIAEKASVNGSNADNIPVLTKEDYLEILKRLEGGSAG